MAKRSGRQEEEKREQNKKRVEERKKGKETKGIGVTGLFYHSEWLAAVHIQT